MRTRVIPVLLLKNGGLYKTVKFKEPRYIGDPINSVRIFNEKEVDELAFIDISATPTGAGPDFDVIEQIAGEAFMPMVYGGGVSTFEQVERILGLGFEKVIFNTACFDNPGLLTKTANVYGAQAVLACIDVKRAMLGRFEMHTHSGAKKRPGSLVDHVKALQSAGAGEICVNSIDRDGTMSGYDTDLIKAVTSACSVPVISLGGAGSVADLKSAVSVGGASAVAAGSMFVYKGVHRAVLINYPERAELKKVLP
jgi:imidazole glycerol-phosphate synthase subunit HisF